MAVTSADLGFLAKQAPLLNLLGGQAERENGSNGVSLRAALDVLKRDAFQRIAEGKGIELEDCRTLDAARAGLLSDGVALEDVLVHLNRAELDAVGAVFGVAGATRSKGERREQIFFALDCTE